MSQAFGVKETLCWTGGERVRGERDVHFTGVSIDTRTVEDGQLFVAIRGPNHDAHRYLDRAAAAGAAGLLVRRDAELPNDLPERLAVVAVDDTTAALGTLAAGHRARFRGPVVGITGSNGKTTSKEMCAAILAVKAPCLKTEGNLNNEFGLPLTLLRREAEHASLVIELGMNHRGEIARLAKIARPTIALITNIGTAHIGQLGSREEIAREKGDLFAALDPDGVAVVNRDDPRVEAQARRAPGAQLSFGHDPSADVRANRVHFLDEGAFQFELDTPHGSREVVVPGLGETIVINALGASAAALAAGAGLDDVVEGLAGFENVGGRMARRLLPGDVVVIDDSYNANPQSMRAALESLSQLKGKGRAVAVLGDMGELGDEADRAHRDAGRWAAELGIDLLVAVGDSADAVAAGAREGGLAADCVRTEPAGDPESTGRALAELVEAHDWVLVKGSRAMKLEKVIDSLARRRGAEAR